MPLYIPDRAIMPRSEYDDPIDYYYRPITGMVYRRRLEVSIRLLGDEKREALLEIGYGSGLLLPELSRRARRLVGVDIHGQASDVYRMLKHEGVSAELHQCSLYKMPFSAGEFDALACFSVLEHLTDLDGALHEFVRVTRPGAVLALGFPVRNFITDAFFRIAGYEPRKLHPSGHRDIEASILRQPLLRLERTVIFPRPMPTDLGLYYACRCVRVEGAV